MVHYTDSAARAEVSGKEMENFIHRESKVPLKHEEEKEVGVECYRKVLTPFDSILCRVRDKELNKVSKLMETERKRKEIEEKFNNVYNRIKESKSSERKSQVKHNEMSLNTDYNAQTERRRKTPLENKKYKETNSILEKEYSTRPPIQKQPLVSDIRRITGKEQSSYMKRLASPRLSCDNNSTMKASFNLTPKTSVDRHEVLSIASTQKRYSEIAKSGNKHNPSGKKEEKSVKEPNIVPRKKWKDFARKPANEVKQDKYQKYMDVFAQDRVEMAKELQRQPLNV
eukprot:TRINITY_DN7883_c0_g3_i1.p1 TRINITY_DN7883_c0_g3~~TRINITY_DN7883_c0_g3_i1.p1  ORF type:complete len:284 (-),score=63.86 TRINITY_DN7883_c0_g3_i1:98-949(-)